MERGDSEQGYFSLDDVSIVAEEQCDTTPSFAEPDVNTGENNVSPVLTTQKQQISPPHPQSTAATSRRTTASG